MVSHIVVFEIARNRYRRQKRELGTQILQEPKAIHIGHADIGDDQIQFVLLDHRQRLLTIGGLDHGKGGQRAADQLAKIRLVVYDQYLGTRIANLLVDLRGDFLCAHVAARRHHFYSRIGAPLLVQQLPLECGYPHLRAFFLQLVITHASIVVVQFVAEHV